MVLPALACTLSPDYKSPDEYIPDEWEATQVAKGATQQVQLATEAAEIDARVEAGNQPPMENPDVKIVFSYSGENQSYHTGLRNRTVFYIDYATGKVIASESASFEEPAGCNTAIGTDSISFDGTADGASISGDLTITTDFTASGCEGSDRTSTVSYKMTGILSAEESVDGQWNGTVTGTATLKQTWSDGEGPNVDDTYTIEWTVVGTPVE